MIPKEVAESIHKLSIPKEEADKCIKLLTRAPRLPRKLKKATLKKRGVENEKRV
ncbi:MAG: hypothetical protein GY799_12185 [Desulfobulbaceae bacterium]|nr:hypothetical protein [Desulfobulbaceae bacterium]